jgi:hypothetical protein
MLLITIAVIVLSSCQKEEIKPIEISINGTWYTSQELIGNTYTINLNDSTLTSKSQTVKMVEKCYLMPLKRIKINNKVSYYDFDSHNLIIGNTEYFR